MRVRAFGSDTSRYLIHENGAPVSPVLDPPAAGTITTVAGSQGRTVDAAVDAAGNLYIADYSNVGRRAWRSVHRAWLRSGNEAGGSHVLQLLHESMRWLVIESQLAEQKEGTLVVGNRMIGHKDQGSVSTDGSAPGEAQSAVRHISPERRQRNNAALRCLTLRSPPCSVRSVFDTRSCATAKKGHCDVPIRDRMGCAAIGSRPMFSHREPPGKLGRARGSGERSSPSHQIWLATLDARIGQVLICGSHGWVTARGHPADFPLSKTSQGRVGPPIHLEETSRGSDAAQSISVVEDWRRSSDVAASLATNGG